MSRDYSAKIRQAIEEADSANIGVQLGKVCVQRSIPIKDVAEFLGVSRPSVYRWFCGVSGISNKNAEKIRSLLERLKDA